MFLKIAVLVYSTPADNFERTFKKERKKISVLAFNFVKS